MWIIVLSTLLIAFISGLSMGFSPERGICESAINKELHDLADRIASPRTNRVAD